MPFSRKQAKFVTDFISLLPHTKGEYAGEPFRIRPWQKRDIINPLFGQMTKDGLRQYRTCYVEIPRKNGKTELAAAIALYLLFADGEPGAEIYSCAADREQASLVFRAAAQMVRMAMPDMAKIIDSQKRIIALENGIPNGSFYHALSAEAYTKHGLNAHGIIFDEVHAQPNRELWDVMQTSTGSRRQPLTFAITTAGYDRNSICWELHDYALKIQKGIVNDPSFLPVIYAADEDADWTDESVWRAANPALGDFRSLDEMRTAFAQAKERPAMENTFRRLYLNQWTRSETRWIPMPIWDECAGDVDVATLVGEPCYIGLDLATTTDIAAVCLAFPQPDGSVKVAMHYWIPEEGIEKKIRRDRVPYDVWVRQGIVTATSGNVIDYATIVEYINTACDMYAVREVAYDPWNADMFVQRIAATASNPDFCVPIRQGYRTMSPATKQIETLIQSKRLIHNGDPVLRWMVDNTVLEQDAAGNIKPSKAKSTERIDGVIAMIMAVDRAARNESAVSAGSIYEQRGMIEICL